MAYGGVCRKSDQLFEHHMVDAVGVAAVVSLSYVFKYSDNIIMLVNMPAPRRGPAGSMVLSASPSSLTD